MDLIWSAYKFPCEITPLPGRYVSWLMGFGLIPHRCDLRGRWLHWLTDGRAQVVGLPMQIVGWGFGLIIPLLMIGGGGGGSEKKSSGRRSTIEEWSILFKFEEVMYSQSGALLGRSLAADNNWDHLDLIANRATYLRIISIFGLPLFKSVIVRFSKIR